MNTKEVVSGLTKENKFETFRIEEKGLIPNLFPSMWSDAHKLVQEVATTYQFYLAIGSAR